MHQKPSTRANIMLVLNRTIQSVYMTWFCLALPAFPLFFELYENARYYPELMNLTGYWSIIFLVLTLGVTPISLVLRRVEGLKPLALWLIARRRYFGIAAFGYSLLHLVFYMRETVSLRLIFLEALDVEVLTGWLGFTILLVLAVISNAYSIKAMGRTWKSVQRFVYLAAPLIFAHALLFDDLWDEALFWAYVLGAFKLAHVILRIGSVGRRARSLTRERASS